MGAALESAREALRRVLDAFWRGRTVAERIALLTLVAAVLAAIPAYLELRDDPGERSSTVGNSRSPAEDLPSDTSIDSSVSAAADGEADAVDGQAERESSSWPDTDTVFIRGGGSRPAFADLASVAAGEIDDDSIEYVQVRSADGNYCERFENVTVDSLYFVPMGIGYTMVVTFIGVVSDASIDFRPPPAETTNAPRGTPCQN